MEGSRTNEAITARFFEALEALKVTGQMRGVGTFARRYGINRRNLYTLRRRPSSGIFKACWLAYLVADWGVDARWLLTGDGGVFFSDSRL
jgi:hypothetical protein